MFEYPFINPEIRIPLRKLIIAISFICPSLLLVSFSGPGDYKSTREILPITSFHSSRISTAYIYTSLGLEEKGLSKKAFDYAYKGYRKLLARNLVKNPGFLTICDFSQSCRKKRLYLIDLTNNQLLLNTWVAHGKNSGREFPNRFSNKKSSLQSSLGFYITGKTYKGEHGLSLRMQGLEAGFNDKALQRGIVVHGADYIGDGGLNQQAFMGRSYGCPAVPRNETNKLINYIKDGTCLFIYHPSQVYLGKSKILND